MSSSVTRKRWSEAVTSKTKFTGTTSRSNLTRLRRKSMRSTLSQKPSPQSWTEGSWLQNRGVEFRLAKTLPLWRWSTRKLGGNLRRCSSTRCVKKKWIVTKMKISARLRVVYSGNLSPPLLWVFRLCPDLLQLLYRVRTNRFCLQWGRQDCSKPLFRSLPGTGKTPFNKWLVVIAIRTYLLTNPKCKQAIAIKPSPSTFQSSPLSINCKILASWL
jgi:hypothetical protein